MWNLIDKILELIFIVRNSILKKVIVHKNVLIIIIFVFYESDDREFHLIRFFDIEFFEAFYY